MDGIDPDGELTEFRPWTHFERPGERQWRPIALAAVVVALAALGWTVWRSAAGPSEAASPDVAVTPNAIDPPAEPPLPETTSLPEVIPTESQTSSLLSEADLMASAGDPSDLAILALAEEAVIAHFTTGADGELASSYVEWARAVAFEEQGETATVAVRFSVVAMADLSWRLPVRTVELTLRPAGDDPLDEWVVEGPPRLLESGAGFRWELTDLEEVPSALRGEFEDLGWTVTGGFQRDGGWDVAVVDDTGASVIVFAEDHGKDE